jgi:putative CocE/NonD family hydrolase
MSADLSLALPASAPTLSQRPMRLVPRLRLRGTQLAGWTPKARPPAIPPGILFDEDVPITMPDGVVLLADLFRPAGLPRAPVLVSWAPYDKDTERMGGGPIIDESGAMAFIVPRGYAVLRVQPRGTGRSGGALIEEMFGDPEIQDIRDTLEWVAQQPWCDGKIGMTGMSAFSVTQLRVAGTRPPHLTAIFPYKGFTDIYRQGFYKGGAAYTGAMELMCAFEKAKLPHIPSWVRHAMSHLLNRPPFLKHTSDARANETGNRKAMRMVTPPEIACRTYVQRLFDHPFDDAHWRHRSPTASLDQIELPLCIGTDYGAVGFHLFGAFELWHRARGDKRLFIGPAEYEFPWSNYHEEALAWYDWQLKGVDNGYAALPPVRYFLTGANRWQTATDWPLPEAQVTRLYLATGDASALKPQTLQRDPPAQPGAQSWLAIQSQSFYVSEIDRYEAQVLQYQTAPFEQDTEIVGPVHLHLTLTATAIDTHIGARLSDVAPDGTRRKLAFGWLMASHRQIDTQRSNPTEIVHDHSAQGAKQLVPFEPTPLAFSLTPISNAFKAGHRLLLEIGSRPDKLCSEAGEGYDMFMWDPIPYKCRNTLAHGGPAPSYLEVHLLTA